MRFWRHTPVAVSCGIAALIGLAAPADSHAKSPPGRLQVPEYKYDSSWPKTLPNQWITQAISGIFVDKDDNVWVLSRPRETKGDELLGEKTPPEGECCRRAPAVIEFSPKGDVLRAWGGPGYVPGWPKDEHTIIVDGEGFVWVGGSAAGDTIQKFSPDGKLVSELGHRGLPFAGPAEVQPGNNQTDNLVRGVSGGVIDNAAHEIYLSDGYLNKRVVVYDSVTGDFKRGWGGYGKPLKDITNAWIPRNMTPLAQPIAEFRPGVHCVAMSRDGLVYVCDRANDRVQVFTKAGKYVKEIFVAPQTIDRGSVGSVSFSPDAMQSHLFIGDWQNAAVWIVDRQTGKTVGRFGHRSYSGGGFMQLHVSAADSKGNIYTGESGASGRLQKFTPITPWRK